MSRFRSLGSAVVVLLTAAHVSAADCERAVEHRDRAAALYAARALPGAMDQIRVAMRACPQDPFYVFMFANAAYRVGHFEEATQAYRAYLKRRPNDFEGHLSLGFALYQLGHVTEAADQWEEAMRLDSSSPLARAALAVGFAETGDSANAMLQAVQALDILQESKETLGVDIRWSSDLEHRFEQIRLAIDIVNRQ